MFSFKTTFVLFLVKLLFISFIQSKKSTVNLRTILSSDLNDRIASTIDKIYKNLQNTQCEHEQRFRKFPPRFGENKGLYRSYIHVNIMDSKNSLPAKIIRQYSQVTDMNMFVSNFVVYALMESFQYKGLNQLDKESLDNALTAILDFHDNNYEKDIPIYTFWKQINKNGTWSQHPENMCAIVDSIPNIPDNLVSFFRKVGLNKIADSLFLVQSLIHTFTGAYHIPPDIDDTSNNLALTGIIHKMRDDIGDELAKKWIGQNNNYEALFKYLKYFAYRPFSKGVESEKYTNYTDLIDSRSYFVLHDFLKENQSENLIFPTTWIFDLNKEIQYFPDQIMPFSVNNVDFNVAANFLFGVTNIVLFHPDKEYIYNVFDEDIRIMCQTVIDLIVYSIKSGVINKRPELAFLYYPSIFDFYWLASRTYSTLKNNNLDAIYDIEIKSLFVDTKQKLQNILKNEATKQILEKIYKDEDGDYYFMEFLGNYGNKTRREDAVFATGLGLNSLINIWTSNVYAYDNSTSVEKIVYDTIDDLYFNSDIKNTIDKLANHILKSFDSKHPTLEGAFFSGSVKGYESLEYFYPSNFNQYRNGTLVDDITDPNSVDFTLVSGVRGYIDDEEFKKMTDQVFYGLKVPKEFKGFNPNSFPYWSSPAVTYAVNLLGLSKYKLILD